VRSQRYGIIHQENQFVLHHIYGGDLMATHSKLNSHARDYAKRTSLSKIHTADVSPQTTVQPVSTTADVIRDMVAAGIPIEQLLIPGQGKKDVIFLADDFNDPCEEFID